MASLIDTNVLVYRFDPSFPQKQHAAETLLRWGLVSDDLQVPHQSLIEFISVVTRPTKNRAPLLSMKEALQEVELLLRQFTILYPTEEVLRTALRGVVAYQLSWFDAHLLAYAEVYGLAFLISEDFQHGRRYGRVTAVNPFL